MGTQRAFLVKVEGIKGYFATKTGGEVSADTTEQYDGGSTTPDIYAGPAKTSNLVCGRPYKPERDQTIVAQLEQLVGRERRTVTVQDTDEDFTPVGRPKTYPKALLVAVRTPEANASSSDGSTFELEFASAGPSPL